MLKNRKEMEKTGYCLTDKAIYYYCDGIYKQLNRIGFDEVIAIEKSEYLMDGFYIATQTKTIKINNIKNQQKMFDVLANRMKEM